MRTPDLPPTDQLHQPVMIAEMLAELSPRAGQRYVDATFGAGGYSRAILNAADCRVAGIDRDPEAIDRGRAVATAFPGRFDIVNGAFGEMEELLVSIGVDHVDGVAFDLGVSSPQLDNALRGFSFSTDGPLDMRMSKAGRSASEFVNQATEAALCDVISDYGEERYARRIARAIIRERSSQPIERTKRLAEIVAGAVPRTGARAQNIHPATRTFQAIRIYINDELEELLRGLVAAERLLAKGGRLIVVAFHSLEDRIVKEFLAVRSGRVPGATRYRPERSMPAPTFELPFRRPQRPGEPEIIANPRARSARLRAGIRTDAPAWPMVPAA
ncbi:MAG: 16S rRNA (cytosine(1402)-N(4))-methyltransferase RsmH [Proteobacteria bacterium]|nr:16S rRNA (cytosine(1402)-N(4))-methyltransferase RsmH [Pseudomonadota bacterium]